MVSGYGFCFVWGPNKKGEEMNGSGLSEIKRRYQISDCRRLTKYWDEALIVTPMFCFCYGHLID